MPSPFFSVHCRLGEVHVTCKALVSFDALDERRLCSLPLQNVVVLDCCSLSACRVCNVCSEAVLSLPASCSVCSGGLAELPEWT